MSETQGIASFSEHIGEGFAAGSQLLQSRYHIPAEAALLINAAAIATAVGPTARIRNPLGSDLPLSFDFTFCASIHSAVPAAIADGFRVFRQTVADKLQWREAAGSRQLRAELVEIVDSLEKAEKELVRTAAPLTPPPSLPFPQPDPEALLRRSQLERQQLLERREHLRNSLAERRIDLLPFILGENPGWATLLSLDKVAFDHCFTAISTDGAAFRELLAGTAKQGGKIARLVQASRHGRDLTDGASIMLNPMLICLNVVSPELLAAVFNRQGIREGGLLNGLILEVPTTPSPFDVNAFADDTDEKLWQELVARLFARRCRGVTKLYLLDRRGFEILEDIRQWSLETAGQTPSKIAGFVSGWPGLMLKLALCLHLAAGHDEETLDPAIVEYAAACMKSVDAKQLELVERLMREPSPEEDLFRQIDHMVGKLKSLGGCSTIRGVFRCYSGQNYNLLTPILEQAVARGRIIQDGRTLRLPPTATENNCVVSANSSALT